MAKALRVIMLSKYEAKKLYLNANTLLPSHNIYTRYLSREESYFDKNFMNLCHDCITAHVGMARD